MSQADWVFLYLHLPKTGGSTLSSVMYEQYHDGSYRQAEHGYFHAGVYYLPNGFFRDQGEEFTEQELAAVRRPDVRAVLGHFGFGLHARLDRPARYMTMLRQPVQRVRSLYHHLSRYNQLPAGMTLADFVDRLHVIEACNDQVRRIAGTKLGLPCDESDLERAKQNLVDAIDMVGITERFDASLLLAKHVFAWTESIQYIPRLVNTVRRDASPNDAAAIDRIAACNRLDIELYDFANRLLDERIASLGPGFQDELKGHTRRNRELLDTYGPATTVSYKVSGQRQAMKVLIAGWFSFEAMGASAGDILARDLTASWLAQADIDYTLAVAKPFTGGKHWRDLDPAGYTHVVFVCGPCGNGPPLVDLLDRFANCRWVGLNLTMLQKLEEWNPFELLIERDSSRTSRPDMVFLTQPVRVPRVGLILVHRQKEYGSRGRHKEVDRIIEEKLAAMDVAVVPIDTRLDTNATGLSSVGQVESMIAGMDLTVTTRLHGTVLSLKNGVPPVVVDPIAGGAKVAAHCRQIDWSWCVKPEELTAQWLDRAIAYATGPDAADDVARCRAAAVQSLGSMRDRVIEHLTGQSHSPGGDQG